MSYCSDKDYPGLFHPFDSTLDFYLRLRSVIKSDFKVLDYGAGRGAWFEDDYCSMRTRVRNIKNSVRELVACDIDKAVLGNQASSFNLLLEKPYEIPCQAASFDAILCDYVLEHIEKPDLFYSEVNRILRPGGYFFARTPHKYSLSSTFSRVVPNKYHAQILRYIQPERKSADVFPAYYRLNTIRTLKKVFTHFSHEYYIYPVIPSYFGGSKKMFAFMSMLRKYSPDTLFGNINIFFKKRISSN